MFVTPHTLGIIAAGVLGEAGDIFDPLLYDPFYEAVCCLIPFDEADESTSATDYSKWAHTITFHGNAKVDSGVLTPWGANSLLLDGNGDYVSFPNDAQMTLSKVMTLEAWVWVDPAANTGGTVVYFLAGQKATNTTEYAWEFQFGISSGGSETWTFRWSSDGTSNGTSVSTGDTNMSLGGWHHIAIVQDAGHVGRIFIDGTLIQTTINDTFPNPIFESSAAIKIGVNYAGNTNEWLGRVAELRITRGIARYGTNFTPISGPLQRIGISDTDLVPAYCKLDFSTYAAVAASTFESLPMKGELSDLEGMHDQSTNPSRITVPSAFNGRYGRLRGFAHTPNGNKARIIKNGGSAPGLGMTGQLLIGTLQNPVISAPIPLATSDYFEFQSMFTTIGHRPSSGQFELEVLPDGFSGAMIYKDASTAGHTTNSDITMPMAGVGYNVGSWDLSTANTIKVPSSGVSLARVTIGIATDIAQTNNAQAYKNGATFRGMPHVNASRGNNMISAPVPVSAADAFTLIFQCNTDITIPAADGTFLSVEALDPDLRYALVYLASDYSTTADAFIPWDSESVDTDGFWDSGSPTKLVVPDIDPPITHVRVHCCLRRTTTVSTPRPELRMNGGVQLSKIGINGGSHFFNMHSGIIPVKPGDYFEVYHMNGSTQGYDNTDDNWFCIEEVVGETA